MLRLHRLGLPWLMTMIVTKTTIVVVVSIIMTIILTKLAMTILIIIISIIIITIIIIIIIIISSSTIIIIIIIIIIIATGYRAVGAPEAPPRSSHAFCTLFRALFSRVFARFFLRVAACPGHPPSRPRLGPTGPWPRGVIESDRPVTTWARKRRGRRRTERKRNCWGLRR
jgi:hypothetical protein